MTIRAAETVEAAAEGAGKIIVRGVLLQMP